VLVVQVEITGMEQVELEDIQHSMVKSVMVVEQVVELVVVAMVHLEAGVVEEEEEELLLGDLEEALGEMVTMVLVLVSNGLVVVEVVEVLLALVGMVLGVEMENITLK
jgi:hypothetical protein